MTKLSAVFVLCLLISGFCAAQQEFPRGELFGGYSFAHNYTSNLNFDWGWTAAPQFNLTRSIGFKADTSGHYATPVAGLNVNSYSFLFGPVLSNRVEGSPNGFTPFLHALAGADRISASASGSSVSDTAFAMAFGGGVDIDVNRHISVRGQSDYLYTKHGTATHQDNVRVSVGVVFKFGGY